MSTQQLTQHRIFIHLFIAMILTACVSVNIGPKKAVPAEDVKFQVPPKPFAEAKNNLVDKAWTNAKSGNAISFLSECSPDEEIALDQLKQRPLVGIDNLKTLNEKSLNFNGRRAIRSSYSGEVDGVSTNFDILVFKKNNCSYTITYVGLPDAYTKDLPVFEKFLAGFKAK